MKKIIVVNDFRIGGGAEEVFKMHTSILHERYILIQYIGSENWAKANIVQHFFSFHFFFHFLFFLKKNKPDIIHIHNFHVFLSPSILFSIKLYKLFSNKKIKTFLTAHDFYIICPDSLMLYYNKNKVYKLDKILSFWQFILYKLHHTNHFISIYKKARWFLNIKLFNLIKVFDTIIAPSYFMKDMLSQKISKDKIVIIRNPISFEIDSSLNKHKNIDTNKLRLIYLGRLSMEKGLLEFIDLLKEVKNVDFSLDIFGDGPQFNTLFDKINSLNLSNKIFLKGRVSHNIINKMLSQYDALLLPSICFENAPLVIIEAFIKKICILTCDYGGMLEFGNLVRNTFFFNYTTKKDLNIIFTQLKKYINDEKIIFENYNEIKNIFSPNLYLEKFTQLYNKN